MVAVLAWPRLLSPEQAEEYVGGEAIFAELKAQQLVAPRVQKKRLTRYDRRELDAALDAWKGFEDEKNL